MSAKIKTWQERANMREFILPKDAAPHMVAEIAELRAALAAATALSQSMEVALNSAFPIPDSQHASVNQRALEDRVAFQHGYLVDRGYLAAQQVGAALDRPAGAGQEPVAYMHTLAEGEFAGGGWNTQFLRNQQEAEAEKAILGGTVAALYAATQPSAQPALEELTTARAEIARLESVIKLADALRNKEKGS